MAGSTHALPPTELKQAAVERGSSSRSFWARARRVFRRNRNALLGAIIIAIFLLLALTGPTLAPYDPYAIALGDRLQPPSQAHWFGTDNLGRDILSRVLVGARVSVWVGVLTVGLAMLVGVPIGLMAGY